MANGQQADPLQQFIAQYMSMREFTEQQRQFGAQMAQQQRLAENQEMQQFAALVPFVERPEQRASLANYFASRNPEMAETFGALASAIPVSSEVYQNQLFRQGLGDEALREAAQTRMLTGQDVGSFAQAQATAGRGTEELQAGQRVGEGLALSAGQQEQARQFGQNLMETQRQFAIEAGQRSRGLDLQELGVIQQGEGQRMSFMASIGEGRPMLRAQLSEELWNVNAQLENAPLSPEGRRGLERRKAELENTIRQLDARIGAENAPREGAGLGGMTLSQIVDATESAWTRAEAATSKGARDVAIQDFNTMRALLARALGQPQSMLEQGTPGNPITRLLGGAGPLETTPFDSSWVPLAYPQGAR